jgi:hypothetical protein
VRSIPCSMSNSSSGKYAVLCCLAVIGLAGWVCLYDFGVHGWRGPKGWEREAAATQNGPNRREIPPSNPVIQPPFILRDTMTDSPGTNLETRIVTLTAELSGAKPLALQWKVDRGRGFVPVSAHATNSVLVITNARVTDSGRYALFGTNGAGATNSKPVGLVVVVGAD